MHYSRVMFWVLASTASAAPLNASAQGNQPPEVHNLDGDLIVYEIGQGPVALDVNADVRVTDPDSPNFMGGGVYVTIAENYENGVDTMDLVSHGNVVVTPTNSIRVGFTTIGLWAWEPDAAALTVLFNESGGATPSNCEDVIKGLRFSASSAPIHAQIKQVSVVVDDGDGGFSLPQIVSIFFPNCIFESGFEDAESPCSF
jgi:hypothetical protein